MVTSSALKPYMNECLAAHRAMRRTNAAPRRHLILCCLPRALIQTMAEQRSSITSLAMEQFSRSDPSLGYPLCSATSTCQRSRRTSSRRFSGANKSLRSLQRHGVAFNVRVDVGLVGFDVVKIFGILQAVLLSTH